MNVINRTLLFEYLEKKFKQIKIFIKKNNEKKIFYNNLEEWINIFLKFVNEEKINKNWIKLVNQINIQLNYILNGNLINVINDWEYNNADEFYYTFYFFNINNNNKYLLNYYFDIIDNYID